MIKIRTKSNVKGADIALFNNASTTSKQIAHVSKQELNDKWKILSHRPKGRKEIKLQIIEETPV
jgi:hypothetical protein